MPETPPFPASRPEIPIPGITFAPKTPPPPPLPPLPPREPTITVSATVPRSAPRKVLVATAIAALAAACLLPTGVTGIGIGITGVVVLSAVFAGSAWHRPTVSQILTVAGILALLGVAGWRSAQWVSGWCIVLAVVATGVLLLDGRSVREMAFTLIAPIALSPRMFGWLYRSAASVSAGRRVRNPGAVLRVGALTAVLLVVFGALFAGADATFRSLLEHITPDVDDPDLGWSVLFALGVGVFTALGCYIRFARPRLAERSPRPAGETWTWAVPSGAVLAVYVAFLMAQAPAMFGDDDYVQATTGLTYADYARSGFWQLFAVTVLTLLVVSVAWQRAPRDTRTDRVLVRTILGGLCLAALVVVYSAIHRMDLYIDAYGATRLRISVMATELWLGAIFLVLVVAGLGLGVTLLPRVIGVMTIGAALAFAAYDPDAQIAHAAVEHYRDTAADGRPGAIDVAYLSGLSPDATGALLGLPPQIRGCVLRSIAETVDDDRGWTEFNVGLADARKEIGSAGLSTVERYGYCPPR